MTASTDAIDSAVTIDHVGSCGDSSTVQVVNNKENFEQQQAASQQQQQQEEEEYDAIHHPLACIDNSCDVLISIFGAGSDKQDQEIVQTYYSMPSCHKEQPAEEPIERQSIEPQVITPTPASSTKALSKSDQKSKKNHKKKKQKSRVAPKGVTVDDDQVEARRKSRFGRWWKKKFKASGDNRSKSAPKSRSTKEADAGNVSKTRTRAPPSHTTDVASADYVDMSDVYNEPPPKPTTPFNSAARNLPSTEVSDSDSDLEEEGESVNVWKDLNDMWEESRHDLVRVISENISVNEAEATNMEEVDLMDHYERAVAAEELIETANKHKQKEQEPQELMV